MFEGIAKTNTTNTKERNQMTPEQFEGIAKTNTTNTGTCLTSCRRSLRVLLKQIQQTQRHDHNSIVPV